MGCAVSALTAAMMAWNLAAVLTGTPADGKPPTPRRTPIVPAINDSEIERILAAAREAGAGEAAYVLLRLPLELKELFREWLELHFPERAAHVMSLMQQMHGGKEYRSDFGLRMKGSGVFAQLLEQRFRKAHARLGFGELPAIDCGKFVAPRRASPQGSLF